MVFIYRITLVFFISRFVGRKNQPISEETPRYKNILRTRKKLPVFTQMDEFLKVVSSYLSALSARGDRQTCCKL